ncbi:TPA: hypothetical protein NKQ35_004628 [Vibrio parahaemolyticus]|nr:hypothetical protein [Vibrio parahaemolyticus]HCH1532102.1 hypothetical protein [Vibrio parahaemolyticus]
MNKFKPFHVILLTLALIALVVGAYAFGVGFVGKNDLSFKPSAWVEFSSFFNGMLSPILASLAAAIAFFSLTHQLNIARKESSLNEQISNYLNHINMLQNMVDKRWRTVTRVSKIDWEEEPFQAINIENIKESFSSNGYLAPEVIRLCGLFGELVDAMQWYTYLHKSKISLEKQEFPRNEWAHFSKSLIRDQDKKMRFCYQYCLWLNNEPNSRNSRYQEEVLIYIQLYESLCQDGTLLEE